MMFKASKLHINKFLVIAILMFCNFSLAGDATTSLSQFLDYFAKPAKTQISGPQLETENCIRDELQVFDIETNVLTAWRDSWEKKDIKAFNHLLSVSSDVTIFPKLRDHSRQINGITSYTWKVGDESQSVSHQLNMYKKVTDVALDIVDYKVEKADRNSQNKFSNVEAKISFVINGFGKDGFRRSDRGQLVGHFSKNTSNVWKIAKLELAKGETLVASRAPAYAEATDEKGLKTLPVYMRTEAIRRGGYALAIADINGDRINDMVVGMRDSFKLLLGNSKGQFVDATKGSGLENLKYVKTAIFADFKNSGVQDLVVTTLQPGNKQNFRGHSSVLAYTGDGAGHFKLKNINFGDKRGFLQPMPAAVGDFNNDGFLDLYVGYPGAVDFTVFQDQMDQRQAQGLYLNDKNGGFLDFTDTLSANDAHNKTKLFPHASMAVNFDHQGGVDLLIADDRNNLSPAYVNSGNANFKQVAKEIGIGNYGYGMSMAASDFNNDGVTDLAMSNVNFNSSQRISLACDRHWNKKSSFSEEGLRLFQGSGSGKFVEKTTESHLSKEVGLGAAGFSFLDYDNDGLVDIYLVNGLWSGTKNGQNLDTIFSLMAYAGGETLTHVLKPENSMGFKEVMAQMSGSIDTNKLKLNKAKGLRPSLAGYQHNKLMRNNGDGTYTDVAFFEGVDAIGDGYIVGTIINKKGQPDLILRNGDPGTSEYKYPTVQYFNNNGSSGAKSVILTLEGTQSNHDGIGTFVIANFGKHKQVQHLVANAGSVQSERVIHFGLGAQSNIPEVEVHWPSGTVQLLKDIQPGKHHIIEPSAKKVSKR